jgi:hypothetical protein
MHFAAFFYFIHLYMSIQKALVALCDKDITVPSVYPGL